MKLLKTLGAALAIGAAGAVAAGGTFAQSAKFAATYDTDPIVVTAFDVEGGAPFDWDTIAEAEMATIHIATHKSVLIGVSGQVGIALLTAVRVKNKAGEDPVTSTALAAAGVGLTLTLVDVDDETKTCEVAPGPVIFDAQLQGLKIALDNDNEFYVDVAVALLTAEASAHHFNFLGVECDQGTYKATATFDLGTLAAAAGYDSLAGAKVVLGNRIITLQEVRAAKGGIIDDTD